MKISYKSDYALKAVLDLALCYEGREPVSIHDTAKRIELEYFRAIKGEDFGPATVKVIGKNVDAETLERLRPQIDYHNSLYEDVQPGDRYSLSGAKSS